MLTHDRLATASSAQDIAPAGDASFPPAMQPAILLRDKQPLREKPLIEEEILIEEISIDGMCGVY